jgi:Uma2 family endonuclease
MSVAITDPAISQADSPPPKIPPLESGDRLTRSEFERRYSAMPDLKKAELIEGVVYLPSPVRYDAHGNPHAKLLGWLAVYMAASPGVSIADNSTVRVDLDNVVQPDALLMIDRAHGGNARIDEDGYIERAPEFIAEVAATSASIDMNAKLQVYRRNEVREYLVWRTLDEQLDWFVLRESEYQKLLPGADGLIRSETFPGLWLDPTALLRGDLATVLKRLQEGPSTPDHSAFLAKLRGA